MHAIAALFVLLGFTTQGVFCFFKSVNYSTPEQCGPFLVDFSGPTAPPVLPLSLTIVPFSANPISIVLPMDSWNDSNGTGSARVTFLPFSSGTKFVAALDDGGGNTAAFVSDVIAVGNSSTTTCLAPKQKGTNFYHIRGDLNQCSHFNVTFDPSVVQTVPSIRAFLPRSFSFSVNATETPMRTIALHGHSGSDHKQDKRDNGGGDDDNDGNKKDDDSGDNNDKSDNDDNNNNNNDDSSHGGGDVNHGAHNISSKEYLLNVPHGFQTVLVIDDGEGHRESSGLFTAGGTSSSSSKCFEESFDIPSGPSSASSSSASRGRKGGLSKTAKILVSILSASMAVSLVVIIFMLFRRRRRIRKDMEKTSFVFTEDIDMGSSFASRFRARISHLTNRKRSFRSYFSYRDEKDGASTYVPTSPIGSLAPPVSWNAASPRREKQPSGVEITAETANLMPIDAKASSPKGATAKDDEEHGSIILPSLEFNSFAGLFPTDVNVRFSKPDVPIPARSRSSESSRFLLGSGYLSSRQSSASHVSQNGRLKGPVFRLSVPATVADSRRAHLLCGTEISSLGYKPSRSSGMSFEPGDSSRDSDIYVSSPICPSLDLPDGVSSQSGTDTIKRASTVVTRDALWAPRYSIFKGLHRDSARKERGRILPFPTTSLRTRSPQG